MIFNPLKISIAICNVFPYITKVWTKPGGRAVEPTELRTWFEFALHCKKLLLFWRLPYPLPSFLPSSMVISFWTLDPQKKKKNYTHTHKQTNNKGQVAHKSSLQSPEPNIFPPRPLHCINSRNSKWIFSSVQSLSCVWLFVTPWTAAHQASQSITNSHSLLKLIAIESVMLSNRLILCRTLLLLPSIFLSIRVFSDESVLHIRWP